MKCNQAYFRVTHVKFYNIKFSTFICVIPMIGSRSKIEGGYIK